MKKAIDLLNALPKSVDGLENRVKVYFTSFGDFSLNITCWYYQKIQSNKT